MYEWSTFSWLFISAEWCTILLLLRINLESIKSRGVFLLSVCSCRLVLICLEDDGSEVELRWGSWFQQPLLLASPRPPLVSALPSDTALRRWDDLLISEAENISPIFLLLPGLASSQRWLYETVSWGGVGACLFMAWCGAAGIRR